MTLFSSRIYTALMVLFLLSGCAQAIQHLGDRVHVRLNSVKYQLATQKGNSFIPELIGQLKFDLQVENTSGVTLPITSIDYVVLVDDLTIASGTHTDPVRIASQSQETVTIHLDLHLYELIQQGLQLKQQQLPAIRVQGTSFIQTPLGLQGIPFTVYQSQ